MAEDNSKDQEDKIDAGFRGVNSRLDTLVGHVTALDGSVKGLDGRMNTLDGRMNTLDGRMGTLDGRISNLDGRMGTLDGRVGALDGSVGALDTGLRAALGELEAHVDEVRDALLADSVKNRDFASIQIEDLRSELKVYADGVIAHTGQLENHETRITKLETR